MGMTFSRWWLRDLTDKTSRFYPNNLYVYVHIYPLVVGKMKIFFNVIYIFQTRSTALSYVTIDYLPYFVSTFQENIRTPGSLLMFSGGIGNEQ